jgi:hypothetical protein
MHILLVVLITLAKRPSTLLLRRVDDIATVVSAYRLHFNKKIHRQIQLFIIGGIYTKLTEVNNLPFIVVWYTKNSIHYILIFLYVHVLRSKLDRSLTRKP